MNYEKIHQLLKANTTIKLITADNAALIISFLFQAFKQHLHDLRGEGDTIEEKNLIPYLADYLYLINKDENTYPKQPKQYLTDWANAGIIRKFPGKNDEYLYELTPALENAFTWIDSLDKREFVGTESRLKSLFEKLKELSINTQRDMVARIEELEEKKRKIEAEIKSIQLGNIEILDDRQIKEQYFLIEETAKHLLSDFKQVEQNFRDLDRNFRKKIITTSSSKGKVLEELFQQQDFLLETDQGRSFIAFWEFLLSQSKQNEFELLVEEMLQLPAVMQIQKDNFNMGNLSNNLVEAGDKTNKTTNSLLEQLRKYLEHKSFFENKRIHDNISEALKIISENAHKTDFSKICLLELDEVIDIDLITERPLFNPPQKIKFANSNPEKGQSSGTNNLLFEQFEININDLRNNIKTALKTAAQISFRDFIRQFEISKGVAEVVAYMEIATKEKNKHIVREDVLDVLEIKNTKTNKVFRVKVPHIIFCR